MSYALSPKCRWSYMLTYDDQNSLAAPHVVSQKYIPPTSSKEREEKRLLSRGRLVDMWIHFF